MASWGSKVGFFFFCWSKLDDALLYFFLHSSGSNEGIGLCICVCGFFFSVG